MVSARKVALVAGLSSGLVLGGCLERTEHWEIREDGSVATRLEFETRSFDDLYEGDAVPTIDGGWLVTETVEKDPDGGETFRLVAEATFGVETEMPSTFAGPRAPEPDVVLHFPTTLEIERRRDGLYYHFHRRYPARPWAFLETARELLREQVEALGEVDVASLPPAQRTAVVRTVLRVETLKARAFARAAFLATMPEAPQDLWLAVSAALDGTVRERDVAHVLPLFDDVDSEHSRVTLEAERAALEKAGLDAMVDALRRSRVAGEGDVNAFVRRFRREQRFYEITEDLGDDAFTISVAMPGVVVGHDGDGLVGSTVSWRFGGDTFRDRVVELMVTSFVAHE